MQPRTEVKSVRLTLTDSTRIALDSASIRPDSVVGYDVHGRVAFARGAVGTVEQRRFSTRDTVLATLGAGTILVLGGILVLGSLANSN